MIRFHVRHLVRIAFIAPILAGCATAPWDDPVDITELLRMAPANFRMVSVIPAGLGGTETAYFTWVIPETDGAQETRETFELVRIDGATGVATYALKSTDRSRFQTQQIRQRAQLLSGVFKVALAARPGVCGTSRSTAGDGVVYSQLVDSASGRKVTTLRVDGTARTIAPEVPACG